jgi:hypothetical protein
MHAMHVRGAASGPRLLCKLSRNIMPKLGMYRLRRLAKLAGEVTTTIIPNQLILRAASLQNAAQLSWNPRQKIDNGRKLYARLICEARVMPEPSADPEPDGLRPARSMTENVTIPVASGLRRIGKLYRWQANLSGSRTATTSTIRNNFPLVIISCGTCL